MHASQWNIAPVVCVVITALLSRCPPAAGQTAMAPSVGAAVGPTLLPRILNPDCGDRAGRARGMSAQVRGAFPFTRTIGVETRVGRYGGLNLGGTGCTTDLGVPADGLVSYRTYPGGNASGSADLRLRWEPIPYLALTAGGGWLRSARAPYLVVGPGLRTTGRLGLVLDFEWMRARFPYDAVTEEWQGGSLVREVSRIPEREWHTLTAVDIGLEMRFR